MTVKALHRGLTQGLAARAGLCSQTLRAASHKDLSWRIRSAIHGGIPAPVVIAAWFPGQARDDKSARPPGFLPFALAGLLALFISSPARAQGALASSPALTAPAAACAASPVYPLPAGTPALEELLARLDTMAPLCLQNAPFHAWRGAVLLALRRPAAAVEALERSLLADPDLPGAQMDYVEALLGVGDTASARGLLAQLAQRPDLPAGLRPLLERELAATDPEAWRTRWVLTTALGLDSNLNNAPSASELTLTFPQGPVTLPLLESARPQSGAAALALVQWQGLKPVGSQLWLLQAELRGRHTAQADTRYQQADLSASWLQAPEAPRQWIVRTGLTRVDFGGQHLLQSARVSALHQWPAADMAVTPGLGGLLAACRPSTGAEAELRRYPASPELNGRYSGVLAAVNCSGAELAGSPALFSQQLASVQLRLGQDQPDSASRPGGSYRRAELRATWEGRYGAWKANTDYSYTRQLDASGYSPLLAGNLARRASRHSLRVELAHPLPAGWLQGAEGFASLEINRQSSNLAAFVSSQKALYTGLRWSLP